MIFKYIKAKTIYESNIQHVTCPSSLPDTVIHYLFNAITTTFEQNTYTFDLSQLQPFVHHLVDLLQNKSLGQQVQLALDAKNNGGEELKKRIIDMYSSNPSSVAQILDLTKDVGFFFYKFMQKIFFCPC